MQIAPLLRVGRGVTALIGGGGKTTLLYTLAEELREKGSVILCTSTHIRVPEQYPLMTGGADALREALRKYGVVCAGTPAGDGKLTVPPVPFAELAALADFVLVEADGAKGLPLKAHADYEPVIPPNTQRVVLVLGADGFGKPISEVCHRPERYAKLAAAALNAVVTPELAARVIGAEGFGDRVFANKVESADDYGAVEELTRHLSCPVVAGSLHREVYTCLR